MDINDLLPKRLHNPQSFARERSTGNLPELSGVYAVMINHEIEYVGYTFNLRQRLTKHPNLKGIVGGIILFWQGEHPLVETIVIACLKPKRNKIGMVTGTLCRPEGFLELLDLLTNK